MTREVINELKKYTLGRQNTEKVDISVLQLNRVIKALEQEPCDVFDEYGNYKYPSDVELTEPNTATSMPCEDVISRQSAIEQINYWAIGTREYLYTNATDYLIRRIQDIPPVNPQPKTGHWIFDEILDKHYYCSECKSMGVDYWDFCPYCGAKMIELQESENK